MVLNHRQLPPLIQAIQSERPNVAKIERRANKPGSTEPQHNAFAGLTSPVDDYTPYGSPAGHPRMTFVSGYTGFVPKLQHYFGEVPPGAFILVSLIHKRSEKPFKISKSQKTPPSLFLKRKKVTLNPFQVVH
jgi:hypothetical protein